MKKKSSPRAKRRVSLVQTYQATFRNVHGEAVLLDLMNNHQMLTSSFSPDPLEMARMEGERNVVLRIFGILKTNAAELNRRIDEALEENKNEEE